jgi:hypothetical protein
MTDEDRRAEFALAVAESRVRLQRAEGPGDEVPLMLTEHELDYRIRKAFADRERAVEKQIGQLLADKMERKISEALPGIATVIQEVRQQLRAEFEGEILRLSGLISELTKNQAIASAERNGVLSVPSFLDRRRHEVA